MNPIDFKYTAANYKVTVSLHDKNNKELLKEENQPCFSFFTYGNGRNLLKQSKWLKFHLHIPYINLFTYVERYKWFKFLKSIPYFKPFINIKEIMSTNIYTVDLEKIQAQQLFTMLVLVRAIQEQQEIVKEVIKYDPYAKRPIDNIQLLRMISSYTYCYNRNHWLMQEDKGTIKNTFKEDLWFKSMPVEKYGMSPEFQHILGNKWGIGSPITKEFLDELLNEQS